MQNIKFVATGISPLLMHSDRFANPLDPATKAHKELTSKRKKVDTDHEDIMKSEWMGSLYYDDAIGIYIPSINVERCLINAAKLRKLGKHINRAVQVIEDKIPLVYNGPNELDKLFDDLRFVDVRGVGVSGKKIMRCRPKFNEWSISFSVALDDEMMDARELKTIANDAGMFVGLGDFRVEKGGKFGKFSMEAA